ncbi:hypothetical protein [Candidatus Berkiella aquae]|uniref:2'-5' RNA ligase n=1 Tax=Candidatus Berkiella aquae TaxID=295108 RepID=A0A0Q9YTD8_9GAMM|nr:hypothetical protein [Candidatus Berkiella aquae]MCS5710068.1 hypothetical protein [Candidatus Berkiella aquae]
MSSYTQIMQVNNLFNPYPRIKQGLSIQTNEALANLVSLIENNTQLKSEWVNIITDIEKRNKSSNDIGINIKLLFKQHQDFKTAIKKILSTLQPQKALQTPSPIVIYPPIVTTSASLPKASATSLAAQPSSVNKFKDWRSDEPPVFKKPAPVAIPLDEINCPKPYRDQVTQHCIQEYQRAIRLMEHSMADVALQYVHRNPPIAPFNDKFRTHDKMESTNPGALLQFANVYSQRYLDLYDAYIEWEIQKGIPMIPVTAGQMKLHGFTSEEIIEMQPACVTYSAITDNIKSIISSDPNDETYNKIIAAMANQDKNISLDDFIKDEQKREKFLSFINKQKRKEIGKKLVEEFKIYKGLPENQKKLLDTAQFLMHDYGHLEYKDIATQLYYVGIMKTDPYASFDERKQMEVRHRVAGDMSIHQNSPGTLGGNPLAYLNMLETGEPDNRTAEFRNKMYFVYMNNHFANAVIRDQERIDFINKWLSTHKKGWHLDQDFIDEMNRRPVSYIPPIFRYGANAAVNRELRDPNSHDEVAEFYKQNPNITVRAVMEGLVDMNTYHRMKLTSRELMNQIGEWNWDPEDKNRPWQPLNFGTGAAVFKDKPESEMGQRAKEYLKQVHAFNLPVYAGISGTLDQSTAMAGLVGLGIDDELKRRELELHTIKMAYLAFMLPGRDHSVHEIMQSSTTYGLDYVPGPGYEKYVYPVDPYVVQELEHQQQLRGSHLPDYYLSKDYAAEVLQKLQASNHVDVQKNTHVHETVHSEQLNYYVGIPIIGTTLEQSIKQWRKPTSGTHWVPPSNLHITIGWLESPLPVKQQEKIAKKLSSILKKYDDLAFSITGVEMWGNGKDVIVTLNEESEHYEKMRAEIQSVFRDNGILFKFDPRIHISIGHTEIVTDSKMVQEAFGKPPIDHHQFTHCSIMHNDPNDNWKQHTDRKFHFSKGAKKLHDITSELDTQFKENNEQAKKQQQQIELEKEKAAQEKISSGTKDNKRAGALTTLKEKHKGVTPPRANTSTKNKTPSRGTTKRPNQS